MEKRRLRSAVGSRARAGLLLEAALLLGILGAALALYRANADFPLGLHPDEPRKVKAAHEETPEFYHPHLLYRATRLAATLSGARSRQQVAEAGRLGSALFACGMVAASYFLFRRRLRRAPALAATALVAVSPIVVVHAHYLKEDAGLGFATTLAALALLRLRDVRSAANLVALGIATGLAVSAKYTGALLFPAYVLCGASLARAERGAWWRSLLAVAGIALAIFALVNAALFGALAEFGAEFGFEARHALSGHDDIRIWGPLQGFAFHLLHSIVPGVGAATALAAGIGVALTLRSFGTAPADDRMLLVLGATFYFALELSPTKPFPGFMRYALPLVPLLVYFAALAIHAGCARLARTPKRAEWASVALLAALALASGWRSLRLVAELDDDTRFAAAERVRALEGPVLADDYSLAWRGPPDPKVGDLLMSSTEEIAHARWIATGSFRYERYLFGARLAFQDARVHQVATWYRALFACPYEEITPRYESFAFSNPTIRIVDLQDCPLPPL